MENLTAKMSCFARAFHRRANTCPVFDDTAAEALLGSDYAEIARNLSAGVGFFLPGFAGTPEESLRAIVDGQLAPPVLARSAFCETALTEEIAVGCEQYLLLAAGYDTFAIRHADTALSVFELDLPEMLCDKRQRAERAGLRSCAVYIPCDLAASGWVGRLTDSGFAAGKKSFAALLGISYYLRKEDFRALLRTAGQVMASGSAVCLDYPSTEDSRSAAVASALAQAAGEPMHARYAPEEMRSLLDDVGFSVAEHLSPEEMTRRFFAEHNQSAPEHPMKAPEGVRYVLARRTRTEK